MRKIGTARPNSIAIYSLPAMLRPAMPCLSSAGGAAALWSCPQRIIGHGASAATRPISANATVPLEDKQGLVDDVFQSVARRYDLMNDLMSGGLHRAWKDALVTAVNPPQSDKPFALLDLAGGTGDVAFRVAAGGRRRHPRHRLRHQRRDAARRRANARVERGLDDASPSSRAMPRSCRYPDRSFDCVTIAFGIRNVPRIERALREAYPRAQDRRTFPLPGIFLRRRAGPRRALRALFVQGDPAHRPGGDRRPRGLSVSGRIDPQISQAEGVRAA